MTVSPLQVQIAQIIARLPEARGFALAGGGALVALGVVDRPTQDLELLRDLTRGGGCTRSLGRAGSGRCRALG